MLSAERVAEIEAFRGADNEHFYNNVYLHQGLFMRELRELCAAWRELQRRRLVPAPEFPLSGQTTINGHAFEIDDLGPYWVENGERIQLELIQNGNVRVVNYPLPPSHTNR